jgi:branched-subunit amino acid aminotransferase/4-amino-4-deoxychorismate lyase
VLQYVIPLTKAAALIDLPKGVICEALLHTSTHITESSTSNIAIYAPDASDPTAPPWLTPRLTEDRVPGLQGVIRAELLERGVLRLGDITVNAFTEAAAKGTRIIGFNGLR